MQVRHVCAATLFALFCSAVYAEKTDSEKPINIEADRISMDDIKKVQIFEGNVLMTQGTRLMRTNKLVVTQDEDGFQKGVATGGPKGLAYFRQKRDGNDDYMEGEGERVEYNARTEKTEFFVRAWVKNGADEVKGAYISYDALNEQYLASSASAKSGKTSSDKVRVTITPKQKTTSQENNDSPLQLTPTTQTR